MHFARRTVIAVLLSGIAAITAATAQRQAYKPDGDAVEAFRAAQDFMKQQDWRSARIELQNAVKEDPNWPDARLALAETALRLFDPVLAMEQVEQAENLDVDPRNYDHLLAHAQWMSGQTNDAIATLEDEPVAPRHLPYAYRVLGRAQMDSGDVAGASATFDTALKLSPNDSLLWTEIGRLRMAIANQAAAIQALDQAVALDPNNIRALELRGRLVRNQFGLVAALPWFERGLAIDPNDVPLLEEYGVTLGEAGRNRDMLVQARKILQLDSRNMRALYMQAVIAARAKNHALARRLIDRLGSYGEKPAPQLLKAICEYELGNPNQAIEILAKLNVAHPNNEPVRLALARALYRSGDADGAWQAVAPVAGRSDAGTYAHRLSGRIREAQGRRSDAAGYLDRSNFAAALSGQASSQAGPAVVVADEAARNPGDARRVIPQIRLLLAQGRFGDARAAAARLLKGNEGVADAQIVLGDTEWLSGNNGSALAAYERARTLNFSQALLARLVAAYRAQGNYRAASETIAAYVAYNPVDAVALRLLAFDLMDRKAWAAALPILLKVRTLTGFNDSAINANIARALSELRRHDDAIKMARLAYRADPGSVMATRAYGNALLKAKRQPKTARAVLRKASKMAPTDKAIAADYTAAKAVNR